jgi:hypothetical protein
MAMGGRVNEVRRGNWEATVRSSRIHDHELGLELLVAVVRAEFGVGVAVPLPATLGGGESGDWVAGSPASRGLLRLLRL